MNTLLLNETYEMELEMRRTEILEAISQGLKYSEIAAKLGTSRWKILNEVRIMRLNTDLRLRDAERARNMVQAEEGVRVESGKVYVREDEVFQRMTGLTLEEKSFENMIEFYRPQLLSIIASDDEGAAIMGLPKRVRATLRNNGIIDGRRGSRKTWRITEKSKDYLRKTLASHRS